MLQKLYLSRKFDLLLSPNNVNKDQNGIYYIHIKMDNGKRVLTVLAGVAPVSCDEFTEDIETK